MGILLLAAFIGVPLLDIAVFIEVGEAIGLWPTLATVILTALFGAWCLRAQGLATLARARAQIDRGALPARELFDGACLLIAGAFLLTPGMITDSVGFLLFVPPFRRSLAKWIFRRFLTKADIKVNIFGSGPGGNPGRPPAGGPGAGGPVDRGGPVHTGGPVIDGEFTPVDDTEPKGNNKNRKSPWNK